MTLFGLAVWTVFYSQPLPSVEIPKPPVMPPAAAPVATQVMTAAPDRKVVNSSPFRAKVSLPLPKTVEPVNDAAEEARLCSIAIDGGSVELVVRTLVAQSRLNLILLGGQKTPVTLNLRSVPLIEAVRHLCVAGNLRFVRLPHTLAIGPEELLKKNYSSEWEKQYPAPTPVATPEPPKAIASVTKIVNLAHIPAPAAVTTLDAIFKERGLVSLAAPRPMVPTLATVETTSMGSAANSGVGGQVESVSRTVVLYGPQELVSAAEQLLAGLDTPRAQVQIAVTMHDVSNNAMRDLGIQWSFSQVNITEDEGHSFLPGKFGRTGLGFNAVIKALETRDNAKLIASPNVSVMDGERGFVLIGERLKFPELIGYSQANTPIFSTQEERVGVYLQVGVATSPDGYVTLSIAPQVSTVSGFLEVGGSSYPQITTREAQSALRVKSGETIILGGLMRDDEIANMERVPILSEIPIFGELFKRRKRTRNASQLVISVTPTIVNP